MQIGTKEDIVLSIAHPNFSFHPIYKRAGVNADANMRWDHFYSDILPALDEMGVRNYEINAMTPPKQAAAIHTIVQQRNGLVSYASDNHGKSKTDAKHGLL